MQTVETSARQPREVQRATYTGPLEHGAIEPIVRRFAALTTPSWLEFQPGGRWLHLERGKIVGARGGEPLGQILMAQHTISEITLAEALRLQGTRPLGLTLADAPFHLPQDIVRCSLERQVHGVLDGLRTNQSQQFAFYRAASAWPLHPRLELTVLQAATAEQAAADLPLGETWRMGTVAVEARLTPDEWALCRLLNGRRTLQQAVDRFSGFDDGAARARAAAKALLERGLLEPSAVAGLRTIVLARRREIGASYHPPAGMIANLFLRQLDGVTTAHDVRQRLKIEADQAAMLLAGLYRDQVVDVVRGHLELSRLLEDY